MAGYVRHVPIISDGHWVVVGCDLVDHGGILGVGAEGGQNYSEAPNGEGRDQNRFLGPGILEEGSESPRHLGLGNSSGQNFFILCYFMSVTKLFNIFSTVSSQNQIDLPITWLSILSCVPPQNAMAHCLGDEFLRVECSGVYLLHI